MSQAFAAALLAGGRSRRMGCDKAFLSYGDPPQLLWERQLHLLGSLRPEQLLISHNSDQEFVTARGVEKVADTLDDCGPLGGLASCLKRVRCPKLLVLAVDLPFVTRPFLESLLDAPDGVVLQDRTFGRYEAVVAVYTRPCLEIAEDHLRRGELAMQSFITACVGLGHLEARALQEGERTMLRNLNRPDDLRQCEK